MNYLTRLESALGKTQYSEEYRELCLSYARGLFDQNLPVIFDTRHLAKLLGIKYYVLVHYINNTELFYQKFDIPKKSGGYRQIDAPSYNLKKIQKWILENILIRFNVDSSATGFLNNKSIVDNAFKHTNKSLVYNIDIKDFFPSISYKRIYFLFYNLGYSSEVSYAITNLVTYGNYLPQGSPCSPMLSNIVCVDMDKEIRMLATKINADYSRYADDMTISTNDVRLFSAKKQTIKNIINHHGFNINFKKERAQYSNQPQFVTGLLVNNGVKIRRSFKKDVEKHIYYCEKYGVYSHLTQIGMHGKSFYKEYLYGKVNFIKSVERDIGNTLLNRLDKIDWSY